MLKQRYTAWLSVFFVTFFSIAIATEQFGAKEIIVVKGHIGSGRGEFGFKVFREGGWIEPSAIAIDQKGNIYVADPLNSRVQKFDKNGKFLFELKLSIEKKRFEKIVDDLTIDDEDNLYILSGHEARIYKYAPAGKLLKSINLADKDITWIENKKEWRKGIPSRKVVVDVAGNIYLQGWNELIKFNSEGELQIKFPHVSSSLLAPYFLDELGNIYINKSENSWEKYDKEGKFLGIYHCKNIKKNSRLIADGSCRFPPQFIDRYGSTYYFDTDPKTGSVASITKFNVRGELRKYKPPQIDFWQSPNMVKFDRDGNLYGYGYSKSEYWIKKVTF